MKNIDVYSGTSDEKSTRYVISYDKIGNPTKYQKISYNDKGVQVGGTVTAASLTWRGRQLIGLTDDVNSNTITYRYDADGLRASKTVNGAKTTYFYVGDKLMYECRPGGVELYYYYDSYNNLSAIRYISDNDDIDAYFFVTTNAQGDVLGIYTNSGLLRASYEYDTWGNATVYSVAQDNDGKNVYTKITNEATSGNIGAINPIRYRGYYYDNDLGLYYLQSRYYDATIGRFINADTIEVLSASFGELTDKNLFAYCDNNPVIRSDNGGEFWHIVAGAVIGAAIGAVSSIVTQKISGQEISWAKVGISAAFGAASGALASTGIGVVGMMMGGAALSMAENAVTQVVENKGFNNFDVSDTTNQGTVL